DLEQFLFLFGIELQVRADGIRQFAGLINPNGGDHGFVVQVLAELDVLLEEAGDAAHQRIELRPGFHFVRRSADGGAEEAFIVGDRDHTARSTPSTSTLILPSGSLRLWTMFTIVPTV